MSIENTKIIEDILNEVDPMIPTFEESFDQHKILFELLSNVKEWNNLKNSFPIT